VLKHREENLRELSEKDPLTMIYNRRKLFDMLEVEVEKANRYCRPLSLLLLDLDYFKEVNDKYGIISGISFSKQPHKLWRT